MILEFKARSFPNRHSLFQFIDNPFTCPEGFASVQTGHSQEKGCFTNWDKPNAVVNHHVLKLKSVCGLFAKSLQLVLGHFPMRLVINSLNVATILGWPDDAPKIDNGAGVRDLA
jgi:hypothetical protein